MEPIYFDTPEELRAWFEEHHESADELILGLYKRGSGRENIMTWSQAVDQALCFGWIDGIGRRVDDERRTIRFTPRRPRSTWSKINIAKVAALTEAGLMREAGLRAFAARTEANSGIYWFKRETEAALDEAGERRFRGDAKAWAFFEGQAPWYRRTALHWVVSAKRAETRERRLEQLIGDSRAGLRIKQLRRDAPAG